MRPNLCGLGQISPKRKQAVARTPVLQVYEGSSDKTAKSYPEVLVSKDEEDAAVLPKAVVETLDGVQAGGLTSTILPQQDSQDQRVGLIASTIEFMKPRCLWTEKRKKKRQLNPEKKQQVLKNMSKLSTLEEWLSSSPGLNKGCNNGGEFHVFKQSSNKIYPSLAVDHHTDFTSKSRYGFYVETLEKVKDEVVDGGGMELEDSSLSNRQIGQKKKVTFRQPEVVDIFIFDLSEE